MRQHLNAMKDLFERTTDPKLKELIGAVGSDFESVLENLKKLANRKNQSPISKQNDVAKAKAVRKEKITPSLPMSNGKVLPSVAALIAYCNSMI